MVEIKNLSERLEYGDITVQDVVERLLYKGSVHQKFLLIIDQFEELYTLCQEEERLRFLTVLFEGIRTPQRSYLLIFRMIITFRADFLGQALSDHIFADVFSDASTNASKHAILKLLSPMTREALREAIEGPAEKVLLKIEDGLTERLLDAVHEDVGSLPLLEFALTLLWSKQQNGRLTHVAYEKIGGVKKALAGYAEEIYAQLDEQEQKQAIRIFTQLIQPGEGVQDTRRIATRNEIGEEKWGLFIRLAHTRLVISGHNRVTKEEKVEIIHEALLDEWTRLKTWIETDRQFRVWQERLRTTIRQWEISNRDESALLRGVLLLEAEEWAKFHPDWVSTIEKNFIRLSEEADEKIYEMREASSRLFARFVSDFSHQLRTPLTSIRGFIEVLRRGAIDDQEVSQRILSLLKSESERMTSLINDMLTLARLDDSSDLHLEYVDLVALAKASLEQARLDVTDEREISMSLAVQGDIGIQANKKRLQQLLLLLLDNACKYGRSGPDGKITLQLEKQERYGIIRVIDNGAGIVEDDIPYIFDAFYRGRYSDGSVQAGVGLGLTIATSIVRAHHGTITVTSEQGIKTEVTVTLPLSRASLPPAY